MRSLRPWLTSPGTLLAGLAILAAPVSPAGAAHGTPWTVSDDPTASPPFGDETLSVWPSGRLRIEPPGVQVAFTAGIWVGAEIDRGAGLERITSTAAYGYDFWPEAPPPGHEALQLVLVDTDTTHVSHEPLGLRLVQQLTPEARAGYDAFLTVRSTVQNVSAEWSPPGWDLENVYLGFFVDPDVGSGPANSWGDDQVAFAETSDGPLAYAYDVPGGGDDTGVRMGLLLRDHPVHAFRHWNMFADTDYDDAPLYLRMRGTSNDVPTLDPSTTVPDDYRMLLTAGPFSLPRGARRTLTVALVLGDALGSSAGGPPARPVVATGGAFGAPALVRTRGSLVTFAGLPAGASLVIHDVTGRRVAAFDLGTGGERIWDVGRGGVTNGVYFYRVASPEGEAHGKVVVAR